MNCEIRTILKFEKEAKKLIKKYPSLKSELKALDDLLSKNPLQGTPLGNNFYKIRLAIKSKGRGKSGGARVITNIIFKCTEPKRLYLTSIYDKADRESISNTVLKEILKDIHNKEI
ncbi:MAG: addiction module toxin RelE [Chitinophagales bacterium]